MAVLLTVRGIQSLKCQPPLLQRDVWDTELTGFGIRVSRTGRKTYQVRYRINGTLRRFAIGTAEKLPLGGKDGAREKARKALRLVEDGIDPANVKQERREAKTFGTYAVESYLKHRAQPPKQVEPAPPVTRDQLVADVLDADGAEPPVEGSTRDKARKAAKQWKRSWREERRIIQNELIPVLGAIKLVDLKRSHVVDLVREKAETAPIMANRIASLVRRILNCALEDELIEANVATRIKKYDEPSRERVLTDAEIAELWAALGETERKDEQGRPMARLNETLNDAYKSRFLALQRGKEVGYMRWPDVDLVAGMWVIPGEYTKNKLPHRVPLSDPIVEILARRLQKARPTAVWVFENTPGTNIAARMKKAAAFLCRGDAHLSRRRKGAKGPSKRKQRPPYQPGVSFSFWGHDLRRTGSTALGEAGVPDETISRVLNHIETGNPRVTRTYNRAKYDAAKRAALELWARRLAAIVTGQSSNNVLTFTKGA